MNNTTNNIQNTINQNIIIGMPQNNYDVNEFLHERIDYLTDEYIMKCAKRLDNGLVDLIKNVRFNPDHPENMNVKMHTKRDKTLYVFKNNKWEISDAKWTLEEMIIHGARIIQQRFLTQADHEKLLEDDSVESRIQTWLLSLMPRNNEKLIGKISKRVYAMILNNENVVILLDDDHIPDSLPESKMINAT